MKIVDLRIEGDQADYVMRWTMGGPFALKFVRRPVTHPPVDGTICFVDDGTREGYRNGQVIARYRDGQWDNGKGQALRFEPTHWTEMDCA